MKRKKPENPRRVSTCLRRLVSRLTFFPVAGTAVLYHCSLRETHRQVPCCEHPNQGSNPHPWYTPPPAVEPAAPWRRGQRSHQLSHPARATCIISSIFIWRTFFAIHYFPSFGISECSCVCSSGCLCIHSVYRALSLPYFFRRLYSLVCSSVFLSLTCCLCNCRCYCSSLRFSPSPSLSRLYDLYFPRMYTT